MTSASDDRRTLVDLLPQFLRRRRAGWPGLLEISAESGLEPPFIFLLRAIVEETNPGVSMTEDELRANLFNPYNTIHPFIAMLPRLVERGYLAQNDRRFVATEQGRALIERMERDAQAFVAARNPAPERSIARLADIFELIAARLWLASEPTAKPHQARSRRLPYTRDNPPLVRLDHAAYALWTARDDAHTAAWRATGFDGPTFDVLSQIWSGAATTLAELINKLNHSQRPEDIERGVQALVDRDFVQRDGEQLRLSPLGQHTRDAIEAETDRIYFAPWPELPPHELAWMRATFQAIVDGLAAGDRS